MTKKDEFVNLIKQQLNIDLENEEGGLNKHRNILYTKVRNSDKLPLLSYLTKKGNRYSEHMNDYYWIWL